MLRTRIIGLGNPILGDDGIGWRVAEQIEKELEAKRRSFPHLRIDIQKFSLGGLSLMEQMIDTDAVILIDAIQTGHKPVGSVYKLDLDKLPNYSAGHTTSTHDTSLQNALQAGKLLGAQLPEIIWVVAIEAEKVYEFSENLSPAVEQAIPVACQAVWDYLTELEEKR
ncbi:MAG: hydrogenase maturation protease [Anaerolineales bacterium]|nr:hydrogenase maturation protease [Anaerolineales bacterium]